MASIGANQAETPWLEVYPPNSYPALEANHTADVAVIGGGLTGVLTAYLLAEAGKKVILIEKNKIGSGTTAYTTGFLTEALDTNVSDLYHSFGKDAAREIIGSHRNAMDLIEELVKKHGIDCEFTRVPNYIYASSEADALALEHELIYYRRLGTEARFLDGKDFPFKNSGVLEVKNQAKFHSLKFLHALAGELRKMGAEIYEHTGAQEVSRVASQVASLARVATPLATIDAEWVAVVTYNPFNSPPSLYFKKGTYTTYTMELELKNSDFPEGIYEDTESPYHYFRIDKLGGRVRAIVGGEDHRKDIKIDPDRNWNALYKYAEGVFGKDNFILKKKWDGPILEPVDGIPSLGRINRNEKILYTIGFSGNGMTYAGISALLFRDIIMGNKTPLENIFDPNRLPRIGAIIRKGRDYFKILYGGAITNYFREKREPEF